jgi:hypothetical protein
MGSPLFATHRQQLLALALQHRLPTMAYGRHLAEAGSLLAYGTDSRELCQRSAVFVHKILHGVKPADLPIEQGSLQLVVNLKTAEALGVTIPPTFLFQADEVIKQRREQEHDMGWSTRARVRELEHPSAVHRALPAEPGSGADGPHDRLFPLRGCRWRVARRSPRAFGCKKQNKRESQEVRGISKHSAKLAPPRIPT